MPWVSDLILDQTDDGICIQDEFGRIEWANPACERLFGWKQDDMRGRRALDFILPPDAAAAGAKPDDFKYDFDRSIFGRTIVRKNMRRDGSLFWNQQSFAKIQVGPDLDQTKVVITCRDVTEYMSTETALHKVQVDLEHAAFHDDLTGIANRKRLTQFLQSEAVRQALARREIGVLQLDIDKFKDINDTLGHAAGDATLCHVAAALREHSNRRDLACRTGGDEFLLICLDTKSGAALTARAEELQATIATPFTWKDQIIRINISIGASTPTSSRTTGERLIQHADQALYSAKNGGRDRVVLYTDTLGRQYKAQQKLMRDLKTALVENQFEVHLQPQLCLANKQITGCEALIRWLHPEHGLLPPARFLPAAEQAGLLADIDYVSMNLSLDALRQIQQKGYPDLFMSINVSSSIMDDVNYPGLLDWALQSRGISPENICIEILETTILDGGGLGITTAVERLKRLGVQISLDDFGTGYAGLAHMSTFEIDAIKLDRTMIARLSDDPRNRIIVRSIIRLCSLLGIDVVAEGVETQSQLEILHRARCPFIQGYGLARPMSVSDAINWLEDHTTPENGVCFDKLPLSASGIAPCTPLQMDGSG